MRLPVHCPLLVSSSCFWELPVESHPWTSSRPRLSTEPCCCLCPLLGAQAHRYHPTALQKSRMPELEPPFRPREKLLELQKHFQNIHKHTYLKGRYDAVTSVGIPLALAASSLFLIGRGVYNMSHGIGKKE